MNSRLRKLSRLSRPRNTSVHELIIDGEIIEVSMPRIRDINPKDRVSQIKQMADQIDGPKLCTMYLMFLVDGWTIDDKKVRSPYWMMNAIEFQWDCVPEYLKCLKSIKERVVKTYSIELTTDLGSVIALSTTKNPVLY